MPRLTFLVLACGLAAACGSSGNGDKGRDAQAGAGGDASAGDMSMDVQMDLEMDAAGDGDAWDAAGDGDAGGDAIDGDAGGEAIDGDAGGDAIDAGNEPEGGSACVVPPDYANVSDAPLVIGDSSACRVVSPLNVWRAEAVGNFSAATEIFALSATDAWMSNLHWNGETWSWDGITPSGTSAWASATNDVWIGGPSLLWHWDGTAWVQRTPPGATYPRLIRGFAKDDVWVTETIEPTVHRWNGSGWTSMTAPVGSVEAFWGTASNDIWLAGGSPSRLYRWDGSVWRASFVPLPPAHFYGLWGSGPNDVWLATDRGMVHFDGTGWSLVDDTMRARGGMWGSCASDIWVPIANGTRSVGVHLGHFDGRKWSRVAVSYVQHAIAIHGSGPDDVWVTTLNGDGSGYNHPVYHLYPGLPESSCGNGRLDPGEECDSAARCISCRVVPGCGDGVIDPAGNETCDPPNGITCGADCQMLTMCGNGYLDPCEACEPPGTPSYPGVPGCDLNCRIPKCGNLVLDPGEGCEPPSSGWRPGHGSPLYCGLDCQTHDACTECHARCDNDPAGFAACAQQSCYAGSNSPCGA